MLIKAHSESRRARTIRTVPPRSFLYSIKPVGIGSPYVESLSSYVGRLAAAHIIPIDMFINKIIVPQMETSYQIGSGELLRIINGMSHTTQEVLKVLERLTKQNNFTVMTMFQWRHIIDDHGLLHERKRWCPLCYRQFKQDLGFAYDPLIWSLKVTVMCPIHSITLETRCPNPNCPGQSRNRHFYNPGYCQGCGIWLGSLEQCTLRVEQSSSAIDELLVYGQWCVEAANEIDRHLGQWIHELEEEGLNSKQLSRLLGRHRRTIAGWRTGARIQIANLLEIHERTQISFKDMFSAQLQHSKLTPWERDLPEKQCDSKRRCNPKLLHETLQSIYEETNCEPVNLSRVALLTGYSIDTLKRHCPELCNAIASRYKKYQRVLKKHRSKIRIIKVSQATLALARRGVYPSLSKIQKAIHISHLSYHPELLNAWRRTINDLELN